MDNRESEESYNHILKYTGIFGGVQGLNIAIGILRSKLIAIILGPSGMGLVSLFNSVLNFISQSTNFGISFSAVKHISETLKNNDDAQAKHFIKVVRAWSFVTALIGMFVCIVAGPIISKILFAESNYTLHFIVLSPIVAMLAITGGETAILKGACRLHDLAIIQICCIFAAILISVPIYYLWGKSGIVPVLILMALVSMLCTIFFSYKQYPLQLRGAKGLFGEGMEMIKLGVAFVLTGILGSGAEMVIRSFLNVNADLDTVGLYNAGYILTITYAGMVFSAMETDYFPRISAINNDNKAINVIANRQIEVSLLIIAPMLTALIIGLPIILPLLYSNSFAPVIAMAQVTVLSMFFKAITLPIAYIPLAKCDSIAYFCLEAIYDIALVALVIIGFNMWGLLGTGIALTVAHLLDMILIAVYVHIRYQCNISTQVIKLALILLTLGVAAYAVTFISHIGLYITLGTIAVLLSTATSFYVLKNKTSLLRQLKQKYFKHD